MHPFASGVSQMLYYAKLSEKCAMPSEKFIAWMKAATPAEQNELAVLAATSRSMLYQLQYSKEKGGRQASSELAGRIEDAVIAMGDRGGRLPALTRADLSSACASCPHLRNCRGSK